MAVHLKDGGVRGWGYCGRLGPSQWGTLDRAWDQCATGRAQSPIHIPADHDAKPLGLSFQHMSGLGGVVDVDGVKQLLINSVNGLVFRGKEYRFVQMHLHTPCEHHIGDFTAPAELHLVHQAADESLAVVGVFVLEGDDNPVLSALIDHRRAVQTEFEPIHGPGISLADALPSDLQGWQYDGSLSTPPCSEGVTWLVLKAPVTCSAHRLAQFHASFGDCARPTQPLNGRTINGERPPEPSRPE